MSVVERTMRQALSAVLLEDLRLLDAELDELAGAVECEAVDPDVLEPDVLDAEADVIDLEVIDVEAVPLTDLAPGRDLDDALRSIRAVGDLSSHDLLELVAAQERAIAALHAAQVEALAEFGRRGEGGREFAPDELMARMRWTAWTAQHRLDEAERLTSCMPRTWSDLADGSLDYARVRTIIAGTRELGEQDAAAVDEALDGVAGELTTGQLRQRVMVEVAAVDARAAERRAHRARAARRVEVTPLPDGQAQLLAEGPAEDVLAVMRALTHAAGSGEPADDRGIDARRFDVLRDWARSVLDGAPAASGAWKPQVSLTMAVTTLLGLDDNPGMLAGYGPVPAGVARRIAADGTLRRLFTDPVTGVLVGVDGHTYPGVGPPDDDPGPPDDTPGPPDDDPGPGDHDPGPPGGDPGPTDPGPTDHDPGPPPASAAVPGSPPSRSSCPVAATGGGPYRPRRALDRLVRLRDTTCTAIGCRRPAERCDLDHVVPHPLGPTCSCNLHPQCRRHHRMKHRSGASVRRLPDGSTVWTMPTGHEYLRPAAVPLPRPRVRRSVEVGSDSVTAPLRPAVAHDSGAAGLARLTEAVEGPGAPEDQTALLGPPPF